MKIKRIKINLNKERLGCFPVMGVILGFPHKINEHNNLTRLEKLELALLDQHE